MRQFLQFSILLILGASFACNQMQGDSRGESSVVDTDAKKPEQKGKFTGTKEDHYANGKLKTSVSYKEGIRDGEAISYYDNGKLCMKETYVMGKREGKYQWFDKRGNLYKEVDYINGNKNGWEKVYYTSGKLKYKMEYERDQPTGKLEEYRSDGSQIKLPDLVVSNKGLAGNGNYVFEVKFDDKISQKRFYMGVMEGGKFRPRWMCENTSTGNSAKCKIEVPKGTFYKGKLAFKGEGKTVMKNEFFTIKEMDVNLRN